jgi:hypothetical protein
LNKFSRDLIKSLDEAADHAEGRAISARVHVVEVPDGRAVRRKLHMSQQGIRAGLSNSSADAEKLGEGSAAAGRPSGGLSPRDRDAPARDQRGS